MHDINFITRTIIDSAMRIHTALGPGLFESVYEVLLERDLLRDGFRVERQKSLGFEFEGIRVENAFMCHRSGKVYQLRTFQSVPPRADVNVISLSCARASRYAR